MNSEKNAMPIGLITDRNPLFLISDTYAEAFWFASIKYIPKNLWIWCDTSSPDRRLRGAYERTYVWLGREMSPDLQHLIKTRKMKCIHRDSIPVFDPSKVAYRDNT